MQLSEQEIRMIEILLRAGEDFSVVIERPQGALHIVVSAVSKGANRAWDDMIPYAGDPDKTCFDGTIPTAQLG